MLTLQTHQSEFCPASFYPRPQVKNPRACERTECQRKRQRSNELAWRARNETSQDAEYHRICRQGRLKRLQEFAAIMSRCLSTGATFLNESISLGPIQDILLRFLLELGVRKINKFWPESFPQSAPGFS